MSNQQNNKPQAEEIEQTVEQEAVTETETVDVEVNPLVAQVETLTAELAQAKKTIAGQKDSVIRAAAEVDNVRRRSAQDVDKARKFALEKFINELLPVLDNMERALQTPGIEDDAAKSLVEGIELTQKSFLSTVEKFGVKMIDPVGDAFNAEQHQAMLMQPSEDVPTNHVIAVMQKGYELNSRLLRPAMVIVSKGVDTPA